ncbi:MAG: DUF1993 domain-containing protein [Burkholderiaceae bacterium]
MSLSMYQASVPRLVSILSNLSGILDKAQAHVDARNLDAASLVNFRLYPDMFAMARQVQIASDAARGVVAKLAGVDMPPLEDNEASIADLQARLATTIDYLKSFKPEQIDGSEDKPIVTRRGDKETHYTGVEYLLDHGLPNVYFHVTTCYNMLRHNGLEIGKRDYLGYPGKTVQV